MRRVVVLLILWLMSDGAVMQAQELLPEGLCVRGVQGVLVDPCDTQEWTFEIESSLGLSSYEITQGLRWRLLPTYALQEVLQAVDQHHWRHWRLYGRLTTYRGQQFFYLERGVPIVEVQPESEGVPTRDPNESTEQSSAIGIPKELLQRMASRPKSQDVALSFPSKPPRDALLVDRVGSLIQQDGQWVVRLDSLGRREGGETLWVLPSQQRQQIEQWQAAVRQNMRFRIAALKTEYQGRTYLLLLRAVRVYSRGNFGIQE